MIFSLQFARRSGCGLALLLALLLLGLRPDPCAAATPEEAMRECRRHLHLLAEALGNYRQDHKGSFPTRLGDLHPEYVSDLNLLRCPVAMEHGTGGPSDSGLLAPGEADGKVVGYTWEMSNEDLKFWEGHNYGMSFAQFKEFQRRSPVGKLVPVIRCSHHGADHHLNLTEDGTIYESGVYWECNFVDQIPWVRLWPLLVAQADQPMSALVRPRPPGASEAMLDLRPWYNARFEDPWVMGDPKLEKIQPDRELGSGLITSRGIAFDAAGIIQLNGRINTNGGWKGFDVPMYPQAVKSITVKRSFRVIHVLGAVQFGDPPGTTVGVVEIYRASPRSEKWSWRYGVDVQNYRFVPGESESRLESTIVAWTGSFLHPEAQKQKPRLFHLRFVTAEPEGLVDHIDFRAAEGFSSPFIVAITLE